MRHAIAAVIAAAAFAIPAVAQEQPPQLPDMSGMMRQQATTTFGLEGVGLWQQVADNSFSGKVQCDDHFSPNDHKGPICRTLPHFKGAMDICNGQVQSLTLVAHQAPLQYIDTYYV